MKKIIFVALLLTCFTTIAQNDRPIIWSGLDWSSDGKYIAVGTLQGVYIHNAEGLSVIKILDESLLIGAIAWSNEGLKLAYDDYNSERIIIQDLESDENDMFTIPGRDTLRTASIQWSTDDTMLAIGDYSGVHDERLFVWHIGDKQLIANIDIIEYAGNSGHVFVDWHPDGHYILTSSGQLLTTIWDIFTETPAYMWGISNTDMLRWDHTGRRIAGGFREEIYIVDVESGDTLQTLIMKDAFFTGLMWHPHLNQIAIVGDYREYRQNSEDIVVIWDLSTDDTIELPGVIRADSLSDQRLEWSPDGSKLASISDDGRIIIWETENYEVIAEYDGYRSIVPEGTE